MASKPDDMKNIGGQSNDPHYRYKRNIIQVKFLNKQGGLSKITNMETIRKQLHVPNEFVAAFYKRVKKKGSTGMISPGVFRGDIKIKFLENILDDMIKKFLLCPRCGNPEWNGMKCPACGHQKGQSIVHTERERTDKEMCVSELTETQHSTSSKKAEQDIVNIMHQLYDQRIEMRKVGLDTIKLDHVLDKVWGLQSNGKYDYNRTWTTPEQLMHLKVKVNQVTNMVNF